MSEEEAIKRLNSIIKVHNYFLKDCKRETISEKEIQAIDTALKALEKKDRQLEERTNRIRNLEKECQKYFEIMIEEIIRNRIPKELYCEFYKSDEDLCWKTDKDCKDCIKEYFEKKVNSTEEGEK